jgi:branched-chain amino acid transport system permease protein
MFWLKRLGSVAAVFGLCFLIDFLAHRQDTYSMRLIVLAGLYITLSVSLNLINGITGQFSIGHAAFYQIGAYASGFVTVNYLNQQHLLATPGMYVCLGGLALALFGASLKLSPDVKTPGIILAGKVTLAAAAILLVLDLFSPIPFFPYLFLGLLLAAAWLKAQSESSTLVMGAGAIAVGLGGLLFLLFQFFPTLPLLPWLIVMIVLGAIAAGLAGFVVGLPSLRLRGDYLAIVTMGFGEIIRIEVQNTPALGGSYGLQHITQIQPVWLVWLLAITCIAVCRNLIKTAHGLPFLAVREDEIASSAMGVNVTRVKVTAFVIGSMFAGAAGALLAHFEGFITGNFFSMDISFIILTMVVLGGTGSITGSVVSAAFLFYLPEKLRDLKSPDGTTLTVTAASIAAALIAVVISVVIIKRVMTGSHRPNMVKAGLYIAAIIAALPVKLIVGLILTKIPAMNNLHVEAGQLRMVIFAVTLIVLMLLRPQGIFGHHEFSWDWLKKILRINGGNRPDEPTQAVAT